MKLRRMIPIGKYRPTTCLFSVAEGVGSSDENSTTRPLPIARPRGTDINQMKTVLKVQNTSVGSCDGDESDNEASVDWEV
jgi:hypothetical protein